jgi:hypothetical protein
MGFNKAQNGGPAIELLMRLNAAERVTWQGRFRPPLNDAPIPPRLAQNHLPIWAGTGGRAPRCGEAQRPCVCCNRYFFNCFHMACLN